MPYTEIIHDRIMLEIMRGCTRGCRFCEAGMLYRPVRERSLEHLVELAEKLEASTGYEEMSLSSLSSGDYTCLAELIRELMKRLNDEPFETELPMPVFDVVEAAAPIADLSKATIALVTSGGIVPQGNPDHIQSASAQKWGKYNISEIGDLNEGFCTIHGGYDPVYANESPDRVLPVDALKQLEASGEIGKVYDYFYTTTGTGTAVGNSIKFGSEIGQELKDAGVDGVILTST